MKQIRNLALLLLLLCSATAVAQKVTVSGKILDGESNDVMPGATVVLLTPDSTQVTGAITGQNGTFTLPATKAGQYIMRVSFVGYRSVFKNLTLPKNEKKMELASITLYDDAKLMKEAEVTAQLAQVEMKADTFMYNADAYKLPEGSMLEDLVRKLPGAEVSEDGTIKINGKTVSKILVKGKEFFGDDKEMSMKNIPTKLINKIKAYDKKSDYSRMTGIDDGEEETVLDLSVKRGMGEGWLINADAALGGARQDEIPGHANRIEFPKPLYTGNLTISRFTDNLQFMLVGSRNNINNGAGRWGGFGGGSGVTTTTQVGLNASYTNDIPRNDMGHFEIGGNVRYNAREAEGMSVSNSETFLTGSSSSFSNSRNYSNNKNHNFNADMRLEWMPDSLTTLIFRPSFAHSESNNMGENTSVTFNNDPYKRSTNPLADFANKDLFIDEEGQDIRVNSNESESKSTGNSNSGNMNLQVNRRLGLPGRNISLDLSGSFNKSDNENISWANINYYQNTQHMLQDRFTVSPTKSWDIRTRLSYTEPITRDLNLQFSYNYQRRFNDNDRSMYNLDRLINQKLSQQGVEQYDEATQLMTENILYGLFAQGPQAQYALDNIMAQIDGRDWRSFALDATNSQYATYKENNHNAQVMLRFTAKIDSTQEIRLNAGINFQPQHTLMHYAKGLQLDTTVTRTTFNWAPRINMRWKISQVSQLRIHYNARMRQPSMTQLMEVTDDSDPLNVSTGNAGLRGSWSNSVYAEYNGNKMETQTSWFTRIGYDNTKNSIESATIYDSHTGARYTRPMNINGNWNTWFNANFNTALDKKKYWNFSNNLNLNYNYRLSYLRNSGNNTPLSIHYRPDGTIDMDDLFGQVDLSQFEAATKTLGVGDNIRLNYRKSFGDDWSLDFGATGGFNYNHTRSSAQTGNNIDSWTFNYGVNANVIFPWSITFNTSITEQSRRGYDDKAMNTNELLWNATLQKSFLKDKAATISIEWNDILHQRSNVSRAISAVMRTDTYTNNINSYFMVHFIYKLNLMGSKEARNEGFGGRGGFGGPGGGGPGGRGGFGGPGGRF
ncbi:MAG: TonB-dependent receptor [Bacteroidales bacterium]|nr:TonB-dependent receptor [Candidatus Physcousia equi]